MWPLGRAEVSAVQEAEAESRRAGKQSLWDDSQPSADKASADVSSDGIVVFGEQPAVESVAISVDPEVGRTTPWFHPPHDFTLVGVTTRAVLFGAHARKHR